MFTKGKITSLGGDGSLPVDIIRGGWANYINGDATPINVPAGVETKLTLNATTGGGSVIEDLPEGVNTVWDSANSQFDFSDLDLNDMIDIRIDGSLTNTGFNESFALNLVTGIGSPGGGFTLPFASGNRLFAGTSIVSRYNGLFVGTDDLKNFPAELRIITTDDSSGFLVDIYIKVLRKGS